MDLRVPFGQLEDGRIVTVEDVPRGKACEAICPECAVPLVAAKGAIVVHHFRHLVENFACTHPGESALHQFAKQCINENLELGLPAKYDMGEMEGAIVEPDLGGIIPDVLC